MDILIDTLLRAWAAHGASRELYVGNAKVYDANALKAACSGLNIKLLHRPPRDAAPGGLIERFFRTAQPQFEAEIRYDPHAPLEKVFLYSKTGELVEQREQSREKTIPAIAFEWKVATVHRYRPPLPSPAIVARYRRPLSLSEKRWRTGRKSPVRDRWTRTGDDSG